VVEDAEPGIFIRKEGSKQTTQKYNKTGSKLQKNTLSYESVQT